MPHGVATAKRKFPDEFQTTYNSDLSSLVSHQSTTSLVNCSHPSPPKSPLPKSMPQLTTSPMTSPASPPSSFTPPARRMSLSHTKARVLLKTLPNLSRRMAAMALMLCLLAAYPATTRQQRTSRQRAKSPAVGILIPIPRNQLRLLSGRMTMFMMSCKHGK